MKITKPWLLILADAPDALYPLCGISLVERLLRVVQRLGFEHATILSNSSKVASYLMPHSRPRAAVALTFARRRDAGDLTIGEIADACAAMNPTPARVFIVAANFYYDARLLRALAETDGPNTLVDSAPPHASAPLWETVGGEAREKISGAVLLDTAWFGQKESTAALSSEVSTDAQSGRIALIDAAEQPSYIKDLRRNIRPIYFPAPTLQHRELAESFIFDAAQNGTLDVPALVHAPIETWMVSHLCRTSITPNQVTSVTLLVGLVTTLLFASGYLWWGTLLALAVGVLDGIDGKLARVKIETTEIGSWEHALDWFVELSWWTALAHHFYRSGQLPGAYQFLLLLVGFDLLARLAKRSVKKRVGRNLDDVSRFDRAFRYLAARRNIYIWLFTLGLLLQRPAPAFIFLCCWGAISATIHSIRALQIRFSNGIEVAPV